MCSKTELNVGQSGTPVWGALCFFPWRSCLVLLMLPLPHWSQIINPKLHLPKEWAYSHHSPIPSLGLGARSSEQHRSQGWGYVGWEEEGTNRYWAPVMWQALCETFTYITSVNLHTSVQEIDTIVPFLQLRKLGLKIVKKHFQEYMANKWHIWYLNPGCETPKSLSFHVQHPTLKKVGEGILQREQQWNLEQH